MNIETSNIKQVNNNKQTKTAPTNPKDTEAKFSDELLDLKKEQKVQETENNETPSKEKPVEATNGSADIKIHNANKEKNEQNLKDAFEQFNFILNEIHHSEDKNGILVKDNKDSDDKNSMINNDFNISENKDLLPQMTPNMNFSGDGQPFSSFMQNNAQQNQDKKLNSSASELAEENSILSTMAENIAIANKNNIVAPAENLVTEKTVMRNEDIKKIDVKSGIVIETVVKHDSIIMNQADVEMFANIVENRELNLNDITSETAIKSVKISKTLADMLVKAKESNQPLRIDFDNNISVIIKISRDGKISADFLPSTQIAEAYLKENLPLLRQRFDDNNIKYDELNQRERKEQNKEQNRKKGRNDE